MQAIFSPQSVQKLSGLKYDDALAALQGRKVTYIQPHQWNMGFKSKFMATSLIMASGMIGMFAMTLKANKQGFVDHRNDTNITKNQRNWTVHHDDYWVPATQKGFLDGFEIFIAVLGSLFILDLAIAGGFKAFFYGQRVRAEYPNQEIEKIEKILQANLLGQDAAQKVICPQQIPALLPYLDDQGLQKIDFQQTGELRKNFRSTFNIYKDKLSKKVQGYWIRLETLINLNALQLCRALDQSDHKKLFLKNRAFFVAFIQALKKDVFSSQPIRSKLAALLKLIYQHNGLELKDQDWTEIAPLMNKHQCSCDEALWHYARSSKNAQDNFKIKCGETDLSIDRALLIQASGYFKGLLDGDFKEKNKFAFQVPTNIGLDQLPDDIDADAFISAIGYIKTGLLGCKEESIASYISIAKVANYYDIKMLANQVEQRLIHLLPIASSEALDLMLGACFDYHLRELFKEIEKVYILTRYQPSLLPAPFSDAFLEELCFCTQRNLNYCLSILQNHFIAQIKSIESSPLAPAATADFLLETSRINKDFMKVIWPELRHFFEASPLVLKLLWQGGSDPQANATINKLIEMFCHREENQHIMLAYFNAPPKHSTLHSSHGTLL